MDRTTTLVGGAVVLVLFAGLMFYLWTNSYSFSEMTATTTPVGTVGGDTDTTQKPITLPLVITNSTAAPSNTAAVLNGWVTPNGAFTNYWYEYGTSAALGKRTPEQMVGSGQVAIATPAFIEGLAKDTTYYFKLVAKNQVGSASGSVYTFKTSSVNPAPVGGVPTVKTLSANTVSRTGANLIGEVTPNQSVTQYWFEYGTTLNLGKTTAFTLVGSGTGQIAASASLTNLVPLATYYYRINAQNQFGTVNGSIQNFTTTGPTAEVMPTVTTGNAGLVGTSTATLRGTIDPNGVSTTYWFEYSTTASFGTTPLLSTPHVLLGAGTRAESVTAAVTSLAGSTTYYFRLVGENAAGTVRGDRSSFKTKP